MNHLRHSLKRIYWTLIAALLTALVLILAVLWM